VKIPEHWEPVEVYKGSTVIDAYKFACPFCQLPNIFELWLLEVVTSVYCHYCKQQIEEEEIK